MLNFVTHPAEPYLSYPPETVERCSRLSEIDVKADEI